MATEPRYRVGTHQPQNIYRDGKYIGVMFSPIDSAFIVNRLNDWNADNGGWCSCTEYTCKGECCGSGQCSEHGDWTIGEEKA